MMSRTRSRGQFVSVLKDKKCWKCQRRQEGSYTHNRESFAWNKWQQKVAAAAAAGAGHGQQLKEGESRNCYRKMDRSRTRSRGTSMSALRHKKVENA